MFAIFRPPWWSTSPAWWTPSAWSTAFPSTTTPPSAWPLFSSRSPTRWSPHAKRTSSRVSRKFGSFRGKGWQIKCYMGRGVLGWKGTGSFPECCQFIWFIEGLYYSPVNHTRVPSGLWMLSISRNSHKPLKGTQPLLVKKKELSLDVSTSELVCFCGKNGLVLILHMCFNFKSSVEHSFDNERY